MTRTIASLLLFVLSSAAMAQTVAFGNKVIVVGDSVGRLEQVAGKPAKIVPIQNKFGANVAERYEYYVGSKTVLVTVRDGRVIDVMELF